MSNFFLRKFGRNADVDAAEDINDIGSTTVYPSVAFETGIEGGASDIPSSDGIHSVQVQGLDINGIEISEVATLNGVTPVVLTNSYFRVNRMFTEALGAVATQLNSFDILCKHTGSATLAMISAEKGQTLQTAYALPAGIKASVVNWYASAARSAVKVDVAGTIELQTREQGAGWRVRDSAEIGNSNSVDRKFKSLESLRIKPFSDVRLRITAINTDNVAVSGGFELEGFRDIR